MWQELASFCAFLGLVEGACRFAVASGPQKPAPTFTIVSIIDFTATDKVCPTARQGRIRVGALPAQKIGLQIVKVAARGSLLKSYGGRG